MVSEYECNGVSRVVLRDSVTDLGCILFLKPEKLWRLQNGLSVVALISENVVWMRGCAFHSKSTIPGT